MQQYIERISLGGLVIAFFSLGWTVLLAAPTVIHIVTVGFGLVSLAWVIGDVFARFDPRPVLEDR